MMVRKNNPKKSRTGTAKYQKLKKAVHERDGWICIFCGRSEEDGIQLHADHIVPWTQGGEDTMENLQTMCNICHKSKSRAESSTKRPYIPDATRDW